MTMRVFFILSVILVSVSSGIAQEYVSKKMRSGNNKILTEKTQTLVVNCTKVYNDYVISLESVDSAEAAVKVIYATDALLRKLIIAELKTLKTIDDGQSIDVWETLQEQIETMIFAWNNYELAVDDLKEKFKKDKKGVESIEKAFVKLKEWQQGYNQDIK